MLPNERNWAKEKCMWNMRKCSGPGDPTIPWNNVPTEYLEASKIIQGQAGRKRLSLCSFYGPVMHRRFWRSPELLQLFPHRLSPDAYNLSPPINVEFKLQKPSECSLQYKLYKQFKYLSCVSIPLQQSAKRMEFFTRRHYNETASGCIPP